MERQNEQSGRILAQDGFIARLDVPGGSPVRRRAQEAPAGRLAFAENPDGSLTLTRCLDPLTEDMNVQLEVGERPVTAIAPHAFENCRVLQRLILPEDLRSIGEMAFLGCQRLRRISIPGGVRRIGTLAFARCASLTHVRIQPGVEAIGPSAFSKCSLLTRVDIPTTVHAFGGGVFFGCGHTLCLYGAEGSPAQRYAQLNGITFDTESWRADPVLILEETPTGGLAVTGMRDIAASRIEIPEELCGRRIEAIAARAFFGSLSLQQVIVGGGVSAIGEGAFMGCRALELAAFERGLLEVGDSAFAGCERLPQVVFPWGTQRIGRMAFFGCQRLSFVKMPPATRVDALAFEGCSPALRIFGGVSEHEERL